ncbi:MAG: hypothetical protein IKO74_04350 [Selenomonadaceae bacterium]|nr:hypothetical protein [Selenomonadaceae bacterium]
MLKDAASLSAPNITSDIQNVEPIKRYTITESSTSLIGTDGRDYLNVIYSTAINNVTIIGGKSDDTIALNSVSVNARRMNGGRVYVHNQGDGSDIVNGLNVTDTVLIQGEEYSTIKSGNDIYNNSLLCRKSFCR